MLYLINSRDAEYYTEEWVVNRIVHHMEEMRPEYAEALAQEWGFSWPTDTD